MQNIKTAKVPIIGVSPLIVCRWRIGSCGYPLLDTYPDNVPIRGFSKHDLHDLMDENDLVIGGYVVKLSEKFDRQPLDAPFDMLD